LQTVALLHPARNSRKDLKKQALPQHRREPRRSRTHPVKAAVDRL
jgi:hypothetical protein